MPEKFSANAADEAGLFFCQVYPAQKASDTAHPVDLVIVVKKGDLGQGLADMAVHSLKIKGVSIVERLRGLAAAENHGHVEFVTVNSHGLGKVQ